MRNYRTGLYLEVECPGVDARDAAARAAGSIERAAGQGGIPLIKSASDPETLLLDGNWDVCHLSVHAAVRIAEAALNGLIRVVPASGAAS